MPDAELAQYLRQVAHASSREEACMALEQLYQALRVPVYRYALHLCGNAAVAEDVLQDVFVTVMGKASQYDGRGSARGWVLTVTRHQALDARRRSNRLTPLEPDVPLPDTADAVQQLDASDAAESLLAVLPQKEREIVRLRVLVGFRLTEVAALMGLPKGSVFWSYGNAMKKLKRHLAGKDDEI